MLDIPEGITALLFDLDGVLTQTAKVHADAWKKMFDRFLSERGEEPFDIQTDYQEYVDGKPRLDGVRSFLDSRGIEHDDELVRRLGDEKNELVLELIREKGVDTFEGSVDFVRQAKEAGLRRAVVSSSANTKDVLKTTGIEDLFEARIDGLVADERGLPGKPAPDTFLAGAEALGVPASAAAVFEDAVAGVQAGRAGDFGWVVGVDRTGHADALKENGADVVVQDLSELISS